MRRRTFAARTDGYPPRVRIEVEITDASAHITVLAADTDAELAIYELEAPLDFLSWIALSGGRS